MNINMSMHCPNNALHQLSMVCARQLVNTELYKYNSSPCTSFLVTVANHSLIPRPLAQLPVTCSMVSNGKLGEGLGTRLSQPYVLTYTEGQILIGMC